MPPFCITWWNGDMNNKECQTYWHNYILTVSWKYLFSCMPPYIVVCYLFRTFLHVTCVCNNILVCNTYATTHLGYVCFHVWMPTHLYWQLYWHLPGYILFVASHPNVLLFVQDINSCMLHACNNILVGNTYAVTFLGHVCFQIVSI